MIRLEQFYWTFMSHGHYLVEYTTNSGRIYAKIIDDVIGYLSEQEVNDILLKIESL